MKGTTGASVAPPTAEVRAVEVFAEAVFITLVVWILSVLIPFPWWYAAIVGIGGALLGNAVYAVLVRGWG